MILQLFISYYLHSWAFGKTSHDKVFWGSDSKDLNPIFGCSVKKYKICVQVKESGV